MKFAAEGSTSQTALMGGQYELSGVSGSWNGARLHLDRLAPSHRDSLAGGLGRSMAKKKEQPR
jgi:hypothetical protein